MARCVHENLIPVDNPFIDIDTHVGSSMSYFTGTHWVCGYRKWAFRRMKCTDPEFKVHCPHYQPESVANRM